MHALGLAEPSALAIKDEKAVRSAGGFVAVGLCGYTQPALPAAVFWGLSSPRSLTIVTGASFERYAWAA